MELLVAFLIAIGSITSVDAQKISKEDAVALGKKSDVKAENIIWDAEGDDF